MSITQFKLPLIDFTKLEKQGLNQGTHEWNNLRDQVKQALQQVGSFEAIFEEIVPFEVRDSMIGLVREVFDLPLESRLAGVDNLCNKMYHPYVGKSEANRFYESFGVDDTGSDEGVERICKCLWPEGCPNRLRGIIQSFSEKMSRIDQLIRKMVLESLGCEKYLDEHMDSTHYHFRWSKYEAPGSVDRELLLNGHTDKSFLSILYQNGVNGLEIQTKDGEWHLVEQLPNSFVVMVEDSFHAWSNGLLRTQMHRVTLRGFDARYSIGIFSLPKPGSVIRAPDEVVNEEHPSLYRPFEIGEYFEFSKSNGGLGGEHRLKSFCGI